MSHCGVESVKSHVEGGMIYQRTDSATSRAIKRASPVNSKEFQKINIHLIKYKQLWSNSTSCKVSVDRMYSFQIAAVRS